MTTRSTLAAGGHPGLTVALRSLGEHAVRRARGAVRVHQAGVEARAARRLAEPAVDEELRDLRAQPALPRVIAVGQLEHPLGSRGGPLRAVAEPLELDDAAGLGQPDLAGD